MNPIILYPQNAAQAKFFKEAAEERGVESMRMSKKMLEYWEDFDDWLLGARMYEMSKTAKDVSREKVMETFSKIINGK